MGTVGITGGTGLVGQHLTQLLTGKGYEVVIFSRSVAKQPVMPGVTYAYWDVDKKAFDINALKNLDAVVHLAGEGIADKRWTPKRKQEIVDSRVKGTDFLVSQLKTHAANCKTFIAASAIGFYGPDTNGVPFTEDAVACNDFLGNTCKEWEHESLKADGLLRTVILRFGIVLGKEKGAFAEFAKPMSLGIMPVLGSGKQMVSWIEVNDLARLLLFAIEQGSMSGIYNAVAPNPVAHKELMKTIAGIKGGIKIPAPVPAFFLKMLLGEMSEEVLKSCTVSAQKTLSTGFTYAHPKIDQAVQAILDKTGN